MFSRLFSGQPISAACSSVLQLSNIPGIGLKSFHRLHRYFGSSCAIMAASTAELLKSGISPRLAEAIDACRQTSGDSLMPYGDRLAAWLSEVDHYVLCLEDDLYPASLLEIYCPPPLLYIKGHLKSFQSTALAVVGSRRPTHSGGRHAHRFASELAERDLMIISGLAIGVDTFAHQGALSVNGLSGAVLACGLDTIYPRQNQGLAEKICEQGVLISEMSLGTKALPANFPRRNRIISGLSQGVLVVEAGLNSGSLITADFALEQNRDVFAIPGSIDNRLSKGCHALLKQGATLVETIDDIVNVLRVTRRIPDMTVVNNSPGLNGSNHAISDLNAEERALLELIDHQVVSFDELIHHLRIDAGSLSHLLMTLELKGLLSSSISGYQRT